MSLSIDSAMLEGAQTLREAGVREARREAGSLLAHAVGRDRSFVLTHADDHLTDHYLTVFRNFVARRAEGEPLQYITGHQEFFRLDFEVTADVLIPRPETELIVETALEVLKEDPRPFMADIGTGSGCIAISVLHELREARAVATDISTAGLALAQRNAERHGVSQRLSLIEADCLSALDVNEPFSLIATNPPYVTDDEFGALPREVRHEPRAALAAGADGLSVIRRLLREAPPFLRSGGYFVFEIGFDQSRTIESLIDREIWKLLGTRNDLQGIPRTIILRKK